MSAVTTRLSSVPPTVTTTDTPMARKIVGVDRMYRYASRVNSRGISRKFVVASSPGVAKELPITWTKGIRQMRAKPLRMITLTTRNTCSPGVRGRSPFLRLRDLRGGVVRTALAAMSVAGAEGGVMNGCQARSGGGRGSARRGRRGERQGTGATG